MSKETISKIREVLGEDSSKVESYLKEISSDYVKFESTIEDQKETISHVNSESKGRKLKIRELEGELSEEKEKVENLEKEDKSEEVTALTEKLKKYEDAEKEATESKAKGFIDNFDKLKDHADWEKTKDKFVIPEEKEGKVDWGKMDANEIAKNADKLNEYKDVGLFAEKNPKSESRSSHREKGEEESGVFTNEDFKI